MIKKIFMFTFLFITCFFLAACGEKDIIDESNKKDVFKDLVDITLKEEETYTFTVSEDLVLVAGNKEIAKTDDATKTVIALKEGETTVTVYLASDTAIYKEVKVTVLPLEDNPGEDNPGEDNPGEDNPGEDNPGDEAITGVEIINDVTVGFIDDVIVLEAKVLPETANQEVTWKAMNRTKATIDENGKITILRNGEAKFVASSVADPTVKAEITIDMKAYINPEKYINGLHNAEPVVQTINVTGYQFVYKHVLMGSLTDYLFEDLNIIEYYIPTTSSVRPGKSSNGNVFKAYYVTVHDTASSAASAGALTHAKFWSNTDASSVHFTTGNDGVYKLLPYDEVAYHAGDGTSTALQFTDTKIKATSDEPAVVTLSSDGYFEMNGEKTTIKAPTKTDGSLCKNSDLPYTGINNYVDATTGTYWIGNTWWSQSYKTLSNRGGNLNSIGIEKCVNQGTSIWYTWALTAKLIGWDILPKTGLQIRDIKQHNTFSGKNCPQTMREANRWETFLELCKAENDMYKYFKNWTIEFDCDSEFINSNGIISHLPQTETEVTYTIRFSNGNDYDQTFTFTSKLPKASDYTI